MIMPLCVASQHAFPLEFYENDPERSFMRNLLEQPSGLIFLPAKRASLQPPSALLTSGCFTTWVLLYLVSGLSFFVLLYYGDDPWCPLTFCPGTRALPGWSCGSVGSTCRKHLLVVQPSCETWACVNFASFSSHGMLECSMKESGQYN